MEEIAYVIRIVPLKNISHVCKIPRLLPLFRYAPLEKRRNFPHSKKIFLIFNMAGSCKNLLLFFISFWLGYFIVRALYSILTFSSQCWPVVHLYVVISIELSKSWKQLICFYLTEKQQWFDTRKFFLFCEFLILPKCNIYNTRQAIFCFQ